MQKKHSYAVPLCECHFFHTRIQIYWSLNLKTFSIIVLLEDNSHSIPSKLLIRLCSGCIYLEMYVSYVSCILFFTHVRRKTNLTFYTWAKRKSPLLDFIIHDYLYCCIKVATLMCMYGSKNTPLKSFIISYIFWRKQLELLCMVMVVVTTS